MRQNGRANRRFSSHAAMTTLPGSKSETRLARERRDLLIALSTACLVPAAHAQEYPARPIRIVVPFSAGGAVDGPTRVIAQELSKRLGQQVNVENRPGAGATLGSESVAKAPADGYTLLLASQTNAISATLYPKLNFQPLDDFAPISLLGREPAVLVIHPKLPVRSVAELVAYVKERPGQVDYASSGNGSGQHLFAALFLSMAGLRMNHIPYRGSAQATTDLIGGQVMLAMPGIAGMLSHIRGGKLIALAVTSAQRSPQLPEVPTLAESGFPSLVAYVWLGLLAPKGTPGGIIERLHREVQAALASADVKSYMANASIEALGSTPADFAAYFREEQNRWAGVIRETGAKID
jgi:tripartite-type tricarboxylate transporter receptor subunit TctC